jgi:DNA polymerase I-like protein with 3'-5' exonuclease and polymerase domains
VKITDLRNPGCTACKLHRTADVVCQMGFTAAKTRPSVMVVSRMANSRDWQSDLEIELTEMGLDVSDVYFTQAVKCRTFDQTASNTDVKACRDYLDKEIALLRPKWILALGNEALLATTGRSGITKYRGKIFPHPSGAEVIPSISSSAVKRNPGQRPGYLADLRLFVNRTKGRTSGIPKPSYTIVDDRVKLDKLKTALAMTDDINWDVETVSDYYKDDGRLVSLSATCIIESSSGPKRFVFALPLYHPESPWRRRHRAVIDYLKPELQRIRKSTAWNGMYDTKWMHWYGVNMPFTFDPMLAVHLLNENVQKGLKPQAQARLGVEPWGIDTKDLLNKPLDEILEYNVLDTWYMYHVKQQIIEELRAQPRLVKVFKHIMMDGANELIHSEMRGIWLDVNRLKERTPIFEQKLEDIETKILQEAHLDIDPEQYTPLMANTELDVSPINGWPVSGWPVQKVLKTRGPVYAQPNFNASNFARWMLFDHLGLPVLERGKEKADGSEGDPSMAEAVMLALKPEHPVVPLMLERVGYQKTLSSFFGPYAELYDENHRIHTNFKLAGTVTGRLSSGKNDTDKISAPKGKLRGVNLQQVPRDPFVRGVFGAPPGWSFVEADYSQIELRIVAFLSRDPTMLHLYKTGADIHRATASSVLGVPESQISSTDRKKAKAVNFGFVYGMGWRKFISTAFEKYEMVFTEQEARDVRTAFFDHFSGLQPWHARQRRLVNRYGRVESPLGRVRHLPDIHSPEEGVRAEAERQAINSPVQSFGSDMAVLSMVEINRQFRKRGIQGHCLGLVHDAINYEIRNDHMRKALPIIQDTMEDMSLVERKFGIHVDVPILADVKVGQHWGDAKEISREEVHDWGRAA